MQSHPRLQLALIILLSMALGFAMRGEPASAGQLIPAPGAPSVSAKCILAIGGFHNYAMQAQLHYSNGMVAASMGGAGAVAARALETRGDEAQESMREDFVTLRQECGI